MKQRNVRRKKWLRQIRDRNKLGIPLYYPLNEVPPVTWGGGLARFWDKEYVRLQRKRAGRDNYLRRRSYRTRAEIDQSMWEAHRQAKIARYERDPGAWWLNEAKIAERNFFYQCEYREKKWAKPGGWYYKHQRRAEIDRKMVAAYYASDYYQRQQAQRRADGKG